MLLSARAGTRAPDCYLEGSFSNPLSYSFCGAFVSRFLGFHRGELILPGVKTIRVEAQPEPMFPHGKRGI